MSEPVAAETKAETSHARRLGRGTLAQQGAQAVSLVASLVVATALGRTLSLAEFGVWGLTLSFVSYLMFIQGSVSTAAVREIGQAKTDPIRDRAFTTAIAVYAIAGILTGAVIAVGGIALLTLFEIPPELHEQARLGVLVLAAIVAVGWPANAARDLLLGMQRFAVSALAQAIAYLAYLVIMLVLILGVEPPLWVLIGTTGFLPTGVGLTCGVVAAVLRLPVRLRPGMLARDYTVGFVRFGGTMLMIAVTDLFTFQLDRAVLAAFRPAAVIGLFEAAVRPSTFVRTLQGTLSLTVFPASARFSADRDDERLRQLLLRGTRYVLAATAPVSVTFIVLSGPILDAWLGPRFHDAATAMSILVGTWLVGSAVSIGATMATAAGKAKQVMKYSWGVAILNFGLSLALTPALGLEGVAIGTTAAIVLMAPVIVRITIRTFSVSLRDLLREAWLPAYSLALGLAAILEFASLVVGIDGAVELLLAVVASLIGYWAAYWMLWMGSAERAMVWQVIRRGKPEDESAADVAPHRPAEAA